MCRIINEREKEQEELKMVGGSRNAFYKGFKEVSMHFRNSNQKKESNRLSINTTAVE